MGRVRVKGVKGKRWQKGQSSSSNPGTNRHRIAARGKFGSHLSQAQTTPTPGVKLTTGALASHDAIQGDQDGDVDMRLNSEVLSNIAVEGEGRSTASDEDVSSGEDAPSVSMATTCTAYSLIEKAHPMFGRVKGLWNSPTESHREICAVLAAASEVIKTNGGQDNVTEYFGVLVTALESAEDEKSCTAIAYLLSLAMVKTPVEVLQSRYGTVCKIVADKLTLYEMSDSTSFLKSLVKCLMTLLAAQAGSIWSESNTQRVFHLLLNYTIHPKPKLRKVCQSGVVSLLKEGGAGGGFHPAARLTAAHCIHSLERGSSDTTVLHVLGMLSECLANMSTAHIKDISALIFKFISVGNSVARTTGFKALHGLFSSVAGPQGLTQRELPALVSSLYDYQPSLLDAQLLSAWLTVLEAAHQRLSESLCLELLPRLFTSCMDCLMASKPFVKMAAVSLMEGVLKKLGSWNVFENKQNEDTSESASPPTIPDLLHLSLADGRSVNLLQEVGTKYKPFGTLLLKDSTGSKMAAIEHTLGRNVQDINHRIVQDWLGGGGKTPVSWGSLVVVLQDVGMQVLAEAVRGVKCGGRRGAGGVGLDERMSNVMKVFRAVESGLKYKYFSSWNHVLMVLTTFYRIAGRNVQCQSFMAKSLVSLCEMRGMPDFPYRDQLDSAFGAAVKTMGPRVVLGAVPLQLEEESGSHDFPRSWLLPVLKDHVETTELSYFRDVMMPLADSLGAKGRWYLQSKKSLQAKLYSTLQIQVWSLLPGFCTEPVDFKTAFTAQFAQVLGTTLREMGVQLQRIVCQALKQLISSCQRNAEDQAKLSRFAKNFLPILFSLYTAAPSAAQTTPTSKDGDEEAKRAFLLDCVKAYLTITNGKLIEIQFTKLMEKLRDDQLMPIRHFLLNLAAVFALHLSQSSLVTLFNFITPLLDSSHVCIQKKAYSCLEVALSAPSPDHQKFRDEHLDQLRLLLVESLSTVSTGSKKPRLRCLIHVAAHLSEDPSGFIPQVLPEVILCMKEVNEKARLLASRLVTDLGYATQRCSGKTSEGAMKEYFSLVLAGLAGSPHMVSCTLLVLSKLLFEFHDLLGTDLIKRLISGTLVFLSSQTREVVRSTLALVKVTISILPSEELAPHVESMVKSILSWGENKRNHFRLKSRGILERLVRKFGHEMVASFVPKRHQRLMVHIRKANERRKQRKNQPGEGGEEQRKGLSGRKRTPAPSYEELLESSDEDIEEEVEQGRGSKSQLAAKKDGGRQRRKGLAQSKERGPEKGGRGKAWIKEGTEDEPVNFMDPVVVKSVLATDPERLRKRSKVGQEGRSPFETNAEGRLVIVEEGGEGGGGGAVGGAVGAGGEAMEEDGVHAPVGRKRRRKQDDDDDDNEEDTKHGGHFRSGVGIYRANARKEDFKQHNAAVYKAKRAKGDVKKKGQLAPYAYIPLKRELLNKRKKTQHLKHWKNKSK